jgi:hypothetical protein
MFLQEVIFYGRAPKILRHSSVTSNDSNMEQHILHPPKTVNIFKKALTSPALWPFLRLNKHREHHLTLFFKENKVK